MAATLLLLAAAWALAADPVIKVRTDREDAMYLCGEQAIFTVDVTVDGDAVTEGTVTYALSNDGVGDLGRGDLALGVEAPTVSGSLDAPGILRCTVTYKGEAKNFYGFGGAACEPERIGSTAIVPEDFDEYWEAEKAALRAIPMDARLEEKESVSDAYRVFKISMVNVDDRRTYGWIAIPNGEGPFPALMTFTAAGVRGSSYGSAAAAANAGYLGMHIIHHNFDMETPKEVTDALATGELSGYWHQGKEHRDTFYFHHVFLGCVRALDYLTSRPEWDGEHLTVTGSSQGGGLSICLAGLHEKVTALAANVPTLCDHGGIVQGRMSGWPRLVPADDDGTIATVSGYYDATNFAARFEGAAWVTVGLIDRTCPPTSVYSAYNSLPGEKVMLSYPQMGHSVPPEYGAVRRQWINEHSGIE